MSFKSIYGEYAIDALIFSSLLINLRFPEEYRLMIAVSLIGALPNIWLTLKALKDGRVTIDVFNFFAVFTSLALGEYRSFAFIVLMLSFARILDWRTSSEANKAVEELLKLKPSKTTRVSGDSMEEIPVEEVKEGDIILIKSGERVPADGIVVKGEGFFNESSVTGESRVIEKLVGDSVLGLTLCELGAVKVRATRVGADSTIDRMVRLVAEAAHNKSREEKLADRFAGIFLPFVALLGAAAYYFTGDIKMMAAVFLVACADDVAVSIPLAMTAAIGNAARRGVIVKGGEWLEALSRLNAIVFDKTGTLTYGSLGVTDVSIEPWLDEERFWRAVAISEKFSEHPIGKTLFREAVKRNPNIPDPASFQVYRGAGVVAQVDGGAMVAVGDEKIFTELNIPIPDKVVEDIRRKREEFKQTSFVVLVDKKYAGIVTVSDTPRTESSASIKKLRDLGITKVAMFTGDTPEVAENIAGVLGIDEVKALLSPEQKIEALESLTAQKIVGMVGDGINDAPALARANVGIAMGAGGAAVAVEAADVVIMTDDLSRLPEVITLARQTMEVIRGNMVMWLLTNLVGFALVFGGILGPASAAFFNFFTDFLPLINSSRLFNRQEYGH